MCAMLATGINCMQNSRPDSFSVDESEGQYNGMPSSPNVKSGKRCVLAVTALIASGLIGVTYWLARAEQKEGQSTDPVVSYETTTEAMSNISSNATTTNAHNASLSTTTVAQSLNTTADLLESASKQYLRGSFQSIAQ